MFKKPLLILLFIFWAQHSLCSIDTLIDIVKDGWTLLSFLNNVKTIKDTGVNVISWFSNHDDHQEVVNKLKRIDHKLNDLRAYTRDKNNYLTLLIEQLPNQLAIQTRIGEENSFITITNRIWIDLVHYMELNDTNGFEHLADEILDHIKYPLLNFRQILTPSSDTIPSADNGLFMLLVQTAHEERDALCDQGETSHHRVVRIFQIVMCTEIKAHTLLFFAHRLKYPDSNGWRMPLETEFKKQLKRIFDTFLYSLKALELPYIRSCDPAVWQRDENYYGLYGYLQQTIYPITPCINLGAGTCELLSSSVVKRLAADRTGVCSKYSLNDHSECDGGPFGCEELVTSKADIFTCAWEKGPYRIRFVKHQSEIFGTDKESIALMAKNGGSVCPSESSYARYWIEDYQEQRQTTKKICSCQCSQSRVKLVLEMTSSRVYDNYVIVGLRINQLGNYIYIQIAEGKLEANGYIADYSWVNSTRDIKIGPNYRGAARASHIHNSFFLGDSQLPAGFALTGIQFSRRSTTTVEGFAVHVRGLKFDYKTGKLYEMPNFYDFVQRGNDKELTISTKTPINMVAHERSSPKSDNYTHVKFQRSDLSDDYGQTTLPLLDGVPILTNPLSPIGGVGLFYKGYAEDYAGFLSLRLYPVNFTYFMETFMEAHNLTSLLKIDT